MPMLLCRTVWFEHYDARPDDRFYGTHRYATAGNIPHEIKNFLPTKEAKLLGFVQVRNWGNVNINRLGASLNDENIAGITVVWCAQHPLGRGIVVTGWYSNATVFREPQDDEPQGWALDDDRWSHRIVARVADSQLVDATQRDFIVQPKGTPSNKRVFGMADLSYVEETHPALVGRIYSYIDGQSRAARRGGYWGGAVDPEQNARIEKAAVDRVTSHYEQKGWVVRDVSTEDLGWDLECTRRGQTHCVEVKGLTASSPSPTSISRNERTQFERAVNDADWAKQYRLAVVHEAIVAPTLRLYGYVISSGWRCELTFEGLVTQPLGLLIQPSP
jgi:hypothetical protein